MKTLTRITLAALVALTTSGCLTAREYAALNNDPGIRASGRNVNNALGLNRRTIACTTSSPDWRGVSHTECE